MIGYPKTLEGVYYVATTQSDHDKTAAELAKFVAFMGDPNSATGTQEAAVRLMQLRWGALQQRIESHVQKSGFATDASPEVLRLHNDVTEFAELVSNYVGTEGRDVG